MMRPIARLLCALGAALLLLLAAARPVAAQAPEPPVDRLAEVREDVKRLEAAGKFAEADAAADQAAAAKAVSKWLAARKQLVCSRCKGEKQVKCNGCEGRGKIQVISARRTPGVAGTPTQWVDCPKCGATRKVKCPPDDCGGLGFNKYKLDDVLRDVWPASFQKEVDFAVGSKQKYLDLMVARSTGEKVAEKAIEACFAAIWNAIEPIRSYESVSVTIGPDGIVKAKYRVKLRDDVRWEESRWQKVDGVFAMVPPSLEKP